MQGLRHGFPVHIRTLRSCLSRYGRASISICESYHYYADVSLEVPCCLLVGYRGGCSLLGEIPCQRGRGLASIQRLNVVRRERYRLPIHGDLRGLALIFLLSRMFDTPLMNSVCITALGLRCDLCTLTHSIHGS